MELTEVSKEDVIALMNKDLLFAIGFIIDNNSQDVIDNLRREGMKISTPEEAMLTIQNLLNSGNILAAKAALKVPYIDNVDNYTGGHQMEIQERQELKYKKDGAVEDKGALKNFAMILSVIDSVGGALWGQSGDAASDTSQAEAEAKAKLAEAKRTQQNLMIGIAIGSVVFLGIIIAVVYSKKGK